MKKKNSISEFTGHRNETLLRNFRESLARQSQISFAKAFHDAANAPAPRFWVSEVRAYRIIKQMLKGEDPTAAMIPEKQRMYAEIFERVRLLMKKNPSIPLDRAVFDVVNSPAPSSYIGADRASRLINSRRNLYRYEQS